MVLSEEGLALVRLGELVGEGVGTFQTQFPSGKTTNSIKTKTEKNIFSWVKGTVCRSCYKEKKIRNGGLQRICKDPCIAH